MRIDAALTASRGAPFAIEQLELEEPRDGEVLVRVAAAGICHTDLIVRDQWYPVPLPAVLGHEGAGTVERVGPGVSVVAPGDRVAMSFGSCGHCPTCQTGRPFYCHDFFGRNFAAVRPDGSTALARDGEAVHSHFFGQSSFATYALATERNVTKLPPDVPFELVAPFGCGIQTGAGAVLNALRVPSGSSLAVFGTGTVGLSAVMAARAAGVGTVIGIDARPGRLELAAELGATAVIDVNRESATEVIQSNTSGAGVDFSLETTGSPAVLRHAVDCLAPAGTCGVVGAPPFGTEVKLDVNVILTAGRTVKGIVEGESVPDVFLPRLIELWRQGRFPAERLITEYDFDRIDEAARDAEEGKVIKPVLRV
jgi:aryl-alcohol dehydrogenase